VIETDEIQGTLPNIFALPLNFGLLELAMEEYVAPHIGYKTSEADGAKHALEIKDNLDAAMTGYLLFRHWDYPLVYALGTKGVGKALDPSDITAKDMSLVNLDIGRQGTDASKLIIEMRRMMESSGGWEPYSKDETREHPRAAGALASLGCYPTLAAAFPQLTRIEGVEVWRQGSSGEIRKPMPMTIDQLCFGDGKVQVLERFDEQKNPLAEPRLVEYNYNKVPLTEIPWDKVVSIGYIEEPVLNAQGEQATRIALDEEGRKALVVALGVNADAFEIPYKLEQFYATLWMYTHFMRTDFPSLYEEILGTGGKTPDLLVKMNKGIDVAMGMMADAYGLDDELKKKLNNYIRVVFLGSVGAAIRLLPQKEVRKAPRRERPQVGTAGLGRYENIEANLLGATIPVGFLTTRLTEKGMEVDEEQKKLLERIIKERRAPRPDQLPDWFSKAELIKLAPLYPLSPFPQ
jgi:hypothetical protein